jgi:hypothetical protein
MQAHVGIGWLFVGCCVVIGVYDIDKSMTSGKGKKETMDRNELSTSQEQTYLCMPRPELAWQWLA